MKDFLFLHLCDLPYFRALIRAVEAAFYQTLDMPSPTLDLGCGDGHFTSLVFDRKIEIGLDPWHGPIQEAGHRQCYQLLTQASGSQTPFPDGIFASAYSNSVLEHIPDIDAVLKETARVLKPGAPFYFCIPNGRYFSELALRRVFGKPYIHWFKKISRVEHADPPIVWEARLSKAGFTIERWWHYFSPSALRMLEWGHYLGLPSLIIKKLTGRWILAPTKWNLIVTEKLVRKHASTEPIENGTFTFYVARKKV